MKNTRYKNLRPGQCFIKGDDIFVKTSWATHWCVNLKTGDITSFTKDARVTRIHMDLRVVRDGEELASFPVENLS